MRSFVAIDLPDEARAALEAVQDHLRTGRPSDPDTFHLTLAFLGDLPETALEEIHTALQQIRLAPFTVQMRGLGTFGRKTPRALWAGIEPVSGLSTLHEKVRGATRTAGIDLPRERYRPHITLARFGSDLGQTDLEKLRSFLERFERFPSPPFEVTEFTLFESVLTSHGAIHNPMALYPLE